jgi:hypothetical protein
MEAQSVPLTNTTVEATTAFCEYLAAKGYASTTQVEPWKTAIKRVFETVEGPGYESVDWSSVDLDEYLDRFRTLAQSRTTWKVESIVTYGRRVRNALDAHRQFIETGRPPAFKKSGGSGRKTEASAKSTTPASNQTRRDEPAVPQLHGGVSNLELTYPLGPGRFIKVEYPQNLRKQEIDRFIKVMQTLEEQAQIPMHTGEAQAA